MDDEEFNYKTLRKIQQAEKQSPMITRIPKTFYEDVQVYLAGLQKQLEKESKQKRQMLLADEIQNIEKIIINIYEQREKKIIMAAMSKIRGGNPPIKHLLDFELQLFDSLQRLLHSARDSLLSNKKESIVLDAADEKKTNHQIERIERNEPLKEDKKLEEKPSPLIDYAVLRIIKDMPTFIGTDAKQYTIKVGDVLSVPNQMADMLIKRHIAEKIDTTGSNNSL